MSESKEKNDHEAGERASSLMDLFAPPSPKNEETTDDNQALTTLLPDESFLRHVSNGSTGKPDENEESFRRRSTVGAANTTMLPDAAALEAWVQQGETDDQETGRPPLPPAHRHPNEGTALLTANGGRHDAFGDLTEDSSPMSRRRGSSSEWSFSDIFRSSPASGPTPKVSGSGRKQHERTRSASHYNSMAAIEENGSWKPPVQTTTTWTDKVLEITRNDICQPTTFVGAGMFLLYHIVFCLAMGSAIQRPESQDPVLGLMAKMAACGIIFASPVYIFCLGGRIPAMYPTADLFLAPFLAHLATIVDTTVHDDKHIPVENETQVFMATFAVLSGMGMVLSGTLLVLAAKFKLANLGSFLPFPVLCGFFSAVGLLMWSLAFAVDTNGKSVGTVFLSGDWALISNSLLHHLPSVLIAVAMKYLGPRNPFYVSLLVVGTIGVFYLIMAITGTSLEQAKEAEWFWGREDLVYNSEFHHFGFDAWAPPAPFGVVNSLIEGKVHWGAVMEGLPVTCALAFLYLIRCSLHGLSLKKNVNNLMRLDKKKQEDIAIPSPPLSKPTAIKQHSRKFSEVLDIEAIQSTMGLTANHQAVVRAKNNNVPLKDILVEYGRSQFVCALVGSFGVTPSVAASPTMFSVGAEGVAPQYGSVLLLCAFYLTNFQLVKYIPKAAFSCLIVLAFLDIFLTWFVKSFTKTHEKMEWLVVPIIVVFAFVVGLLNAVFLGIAMSTFIFVASFFKSGVVKFIADGLTIRSTIERSKKYGDWLDSNGYLIQIMVLQNYLFFGNASSTQGYISTMFEDPTNEEGDLLADDSLLAPKPKYLILDFSLVTGMDTSTVDIIADIKTQCSTFGCKLYLAGLSPRLSSVLSSAGVKPETGERSKRKIRFFPNLDSALGKAEDMLLESELEVGKVESLHGRKHRRLISETDNGFRFALRQIDEQHASEQQEFAVGLLGLQRFTTPLELAPGEMLFDSDGGPVSDTARGLFFIEHGVMKIERSSAQTLTRGTSSQYPRDDSRASLSKRNARLSVASPPSGEHHFRLARVGPGWVVGSLEMCGMQNPGHHVAVDHCRLHHLPFSKIQKIEEADPVLALRLYKLLSHLTARRQEITIGQLATLHSIMSAPPLGQPLR